MPEKNLADLLSVAAAIGTDPDAYAKHLQALPRPHRVATEIYARLWTGAGGFCTLLGQAWSALDEITDRTEFEDPYGDGKPDPAIIAQLRERITERIAQAQEIAKAISPFVRKIVSDLDGLHTELKGVVDNPAAWATKLRKVLSDLNAAIAVASESMPAHGYHYRDDMLQKRITEATDQIQPLARYLAQCAGLLANVVVPDSTAEAKAKGVEGYDRRILKAMATDPDKAWSVTGKDGITTAMARWPSWRLGEKSIRRRLPSLANGGYVAQAGKRYTITTPGIAAATLPQEQRGDAKPTQPVRRKANPLSAR